MTVHGGIFVGGGARRFGGVAKGLLPAPGGATSIVSRAIALLRAHHVEPVLVGQNPQYEQLALSERVAVLSDRGDGPLGGLRALYEHAGADRVVVLACDMPFVASLDRLLAYAPEAPLVAARRDGFWEPFFSRHDPGVCAPIAEAHAARGIPKLQALFDAVPAVVLDLPERELVDWDRPEDRDGIA